MYSWCGLTGLLTCNSRTIQTCGAHTKRLAAFLRNARRHGHRRQPPRLAAQHAAVAALGQVRLEQHLWQLCCLTTASLASDEDHLARCDGFEDLQMH
jgi:hypothetical protein